LRYLATWLLFAGALVACNTELPRSGSGSGPRFGNADAAGGPDADADGVPDSVDRCSNTPAGAAVWTSGEWIGCAAGQFRDGDPPPNNPDDPPYTPPPPPPADLGSQPTADAGTPAPDTLGFQLSSEETNLLNALNKARSQNGLPPVAANAQLTAAAREHANDQAGGCDHTGSDGSWPHDRAKKHGFPNPSRVNEICAGPGFNTPIWGYAEGAVFKGWKNSPGHWSAIVHTQAKLVGLGAGSNGCYVALFDCCISGS
jgi:uncharacterized protein YkwD